MRRIVCAGIVLTVVVPFGLSAHKDSGTSSVAARRIGFLALRPLPEVAPNLSAFQDGMRELGYVEGKDYVLEVRTANDTPSRYPSLIAELSRLKVELIVAPSTPAAMAIHEAIPTMPIVVARGPDLVGAKLVQSPDRPGGVATGIEELAPGITDKRLRFLKLAVPTIARLAILSPAPTPRGHAVQYDEAEQTAKAIGVTLRTYKVTATSDFERVFDEIARDGADGLVGFNGVLPRPVQALIVELAARYHLPAMYPAREFVDLGGLMSYGQRGPEMFHFAATYVDRILKGARPGDLPLTSTRSYLSVNTKAAGALRITLSASLLSSADDVVK
jgi:ABC-type uncharacterized transport system substrate-binding protein